MTEDYVVMPLADLAEAKHDPNNSSSWHVTPTRSGRVIFDKSNPTFPLKKHYTLARERILRDDEHTGDLVEPDGDEVPMFDIVSLDETDAVQNAEEGQLFDEFVEPENQ